MKCALTDVLITSVRHCCLSLCLSDVAQKALHKPKLQIESVCECWEHDHRQKYTCTEHEHRQNYTYTDEEDDEEDDDDNERRRKSGDQLELKAFY